MDSNGFFDLNFLFEKYYSLKKEDNFFSQPYIELEVIGKRKKFWFTTNNGKTNQKFLYKEVNKENIYEAYGEIFAKEIAVILNIPCADYMLAKFNYKDNNIDDFKHSKGVITPSFLKPNERLVPMGEIISEVYNNKIQPDIQLQKLYDVEGIEKGVAINRFNNLEDIWSILDCYFKNNPNKDAIIKDIMESFVKIYLFDIITLQGDRHIWNFGIIVNNETNEIRPAPIYDNANIFNLNRSKISTFLNISKPSMNKLSDKKLALQREMMYNMLYHSKLLFSANAEDFLSRKSFDKKAKALDSLKLFLSKSDHKTIELLENYVSTLEEIGPINIIKNYEHNMNVQIPADFTEYFSKSMGMNLQNIKQLITSQKAHYNRR